MMFFFILIFTLFISTEATAEEEKSIAIFEFKVEGKISLPPGVNLVTLHLLLSGELQRAGQFNKIVDRDTISVTIEQATGKKPKECEFECEAEIAGALGVDLFVLPYLYVDPENCILILKLHRGFDATAIVSVKEEMSCVMETLKDATEKLAKKLIIPEAPAPLEKIPLIITVYEDGVTVQINGILMGTLNKGRQETFSLSPGSHSITLSKDGFVDWTDVVSAESKPVILTPRFVKIESRVVSPPAPEIIEKYAWLYINSEPEKATIFLNEIVIGSTPFQSDILPVGKRYKVKVAKSLYHSFEETVILKPGVNRFPPVILRPNFGYFSLSSTPRGATLYIDGKETGIAPISKKILKSGKYQIKLSLLKYHDFNGEVVIVDGEETKKDYWLEANFGRVRIDSEPQGAKVYFDGAMEGETPVFLEEIVAGTHQIELKKGLYDSHSQLVLVKDKNQETKIKAVLKPVYGTLEVFSQPRGAKVFINRKEIGTTPLNVPLEEGRYRVAIESDVVKYYPYEEEVFVKTGETKKITSILTPKKSQIHIFSTPSDAEVYLDGEKMGLTPLTVPDVMCGGHTIEIKKASFLPYKKEWMLISEDENTKIIKASLMQVDIVKLQTELDTRIKEVSKMKGWEYSQDFRWRGCSAFEGGWLENICFTSSFLMGDMIGLLPFIGLMSPPHNLYRTSIWGTKIFLSVSSFVGLVHSVEMYCDRPEGQCKPEEESMKWRSGNGYSYYMLIGGLVSNFVLSVTADIVAYIHDSNYGPSIRKKENEIEWLKQDIMKYSAPIDHKTKTSEPPTKTVLREGDMVKVDYYWIDKYRSEEYVTWDEANEACIRAGKRLCTAEEWVFACEKGVANEMGNAWEWTDTECGRMCRALRGGGGKDNCHKTPSQHNIVTDNNAFRCCQ